MPSAVFSTSPSAKGASRLPRPNHESLPQLSPDDAMAHAMAPLKKVEPPPKEELDE
jgi:hypothetical protein